MMGEVICCERCGGASKPAFDKVLPTSLAPNGTTLALENVTDERVASQAPDSARIEPC